MTVHWYDEGSLATRRACARVFGEAKKNTLHSRAERNSSTAAPILRQNLWHTTPSQSCRQKNKRNETNTKNHDAKHAKTSNAKCWFCEFKIPRFDQRKRRDVEQLFELMGVEHISFCIHFPQPRTGARTKDCQGLGVLLRKETRSEPSIPEVMTNLQCHYTKTTRSILQKSTTCHSSARFKSSW